MRQYAIDQVELSWLGVDLKPGLAAGTMIVEARAAPAFTYKPAGAVSKGYRAFTPDRSGTVTVTVDQESQVYQDLKAIHNEDVKPATRNKVAPMVMDDGASGETITWRNAYIMTWPDRTRGVESATFAIVFQFEDYSDAAIDPLDGNVVGTG